MSMQQLEAATQLLASIMAVSTTECVVPISIVRQTFMNHLQRCIRMPAGGALAGGSQQTGFEMEMVTPSAASVMFANWPNHQATSTGCRQSWELRSMQDLGDCLALE